jgi:hypothetical protein
MCGGVRPDRLPRGLDAPAVPWSLRGIEREAFLCEIRGNTAMRKPVKWIAILLGVYVGIVVLFEGLLGYFQPEGANTVVITTTAPDGTSHARVLSLLESDGRLYVAANHWPRAWYRRALANPEVQLTFNDDDGDFRAVPVSTDEHARLSAEHPASPFFRFLTGFPPRYFLRLDPSVEADLWDGAPSARAPGTRAGT